MICFCIFSLSSNFYDTQSNCSNGTVLVRRASKGPLVDKPVLDIPS